MPIMTKKAKYIRPGRWAIKETLTPKDPEYYAKLGSRGGMKTKRKHSKSYYANIAKLSHIQRRANKAKRLKEANG